MKRLFWKTIYKIVFKGKEETLFRFASKKHNKRQYDVVIAFQEGRATHFTSQIAASLHIAWVRCDYTNYQKIVCSRNECAIYDKYDHIVCVSDYTANVFRKVYPALVERTCAIHNLIDTRGIIASSMDALDKTEFDHDRFTLVSVGRMDPVKRFSHIPLIARKMKQSGCLFKWYLIGSGGEEFNKVRERIKEYGIGTEVVLLGAKDNPYPYIANADILVCPSYSEACPNVVNEAKILHVPVVAADFPSAKEYVNSGVDGIVSPLDEIADVLIKLYNDNEEYTRLKNGIFHFHYDNNEIKRKVEALLDGEFE